MKHKSPALTILKILAVSAIFCWYTKPIYAAEYQNCTVSTNCSVGEFLYDDNYVPITSATCTITSRYPDNTVFINAAPMTAGSNGWYSYTAAIGTTQGIYPTQICCTTSPDYLCLDKTFKVVPVSSSGSGGGATAEEIWNYPDRQVTSFGSLVSDIWNYSSRSLSNFGNLVTDIWNRDSRTLTSSDNSASLATSADINEIKKIVKENRTVLEQLVNKPIVKTFIDENPIPNLTSKLEQTKTSAANLYGSIQNLKSRSQILSDKWPTLSANEIKSELAALSFIIKQDGNQKDSNIIATTNWLKTSWNSPILLSLSDHAQSAQTQIDNLINDLNLYGKTTNTSTFTSALSHIDSLNNLVGTSLATSSDLSLYGFIKKTTDQIALLDKQSQEGLRILTDIKKDPKTDQTTAVNQYQTVVLSLNELPQVDSFLNRSIKKTNTQTNKVLGLMAIIDSNRLLLASNTGQSIKNTWLEEGSIIFRSVAINPSHSISQKVTVKYYLPTELKKEQIISHDPELTIDYDAVENSLFASGEVTLSPDETRTFLVEAEDIWSFKQEEIDSLKTQVNDLTMALKNTSQFTQAVAIKSDIVVALDKIMLRQAQAVTPENRIQTYRESALEMNGIEQKITSLKELMLQTSGKGGLLGLSGSVSPVTLWGIVLIVVAGFAFLVFYFNALRAEARLKKEEQKEVVEDALEEHDALYHPVTQYRHRETVHHKGHHVARIASIVLILGGLGSIGTAEAIKASRGNVVALVSPAPDAVVLGTSTENTYPYETSLKMPDSGKVPVRSAPAITAPEIMTLKKVDKIYVFRIIDGWAQIGLSEKDTDKNWWLNTQYLILK